MVRSGQLPQISAVAVAGASEAMEPEIAAGIPDEAFDNAISAVICALAAWRISPWPYELPSQFPRVASLAGPEEAQRVVEAQEALAPPA